MKVWKIDFGSCNNTLIIEMKNWNWNLYIKKKYESKMMLIWVISVNCHSNEGGWILIENQSTYWKIYIVYSRRI